MSVRPRLREGGRVVNKCISGLSACRSKCHGDSGSAGSSSLCAREALHGKKPAWAHDEAPPQGPSRTQGDRESRFRTWLLERELSEMTVCARLPIKPRGAACPTRSRTGRSWSPRRATPSLNGESREEMLQNRHKPHRRDACLCRARGRLGARGCRLGARGCIWSSLGAGPTAPNVRGRLSKARGNGEMRPHVHMTGRTSCAQEAASDAA